MLVDGPDDVGVGVEALPVILPEVRRRQQQASMLGQQVPQFPEAWQQVGHLQAHVLQAPGPRAVQETGGGICAAGLRCRAHRADGHPPASRSQTSGKEPED